VPLEVVVIQGCELTAVQPHAEGAVTVKEPSGRPAASTFADTGVRVNVQAGAWVIVKIWPPTVMVPVRGAVVGLAETLKVTLPELVPDELVVSHEAELTAAHPQVSGVVTVKEPPARPVAGAVPEPGAMA
jgi:hypothetical protein